MATIAQRAPMPAHPELIDVPLGTIQRALLDNLGWLDNAFGRAERLVKRLPTGQRVYSPNVYVGDNQYRDVSPDSELGNFSFFWIDDPQHVTMSRGTSVRMRATYSLIMWLDFRRVFNDATTRNREAVKREVLDLLNGGITIQGGRITVSKVYELAENIYRGFTLDEVENQFLMHPFGGFRFEGEIEITERCLL